MQRDILNLCRFVCHSKTCHPKKKERKNPTTNLCKQQTHLYVNVHEFVCICEYIYVCCPKSPNTHGFIRIHTCTLHFFSGSLLYQHRNGNNKVLCFIRVLLHTFRRRFHSFVSSVFCFVSQNKAHHNEQFQGIRYN